MLEQRASSWALLERVGRFQQGLWFVAGDFNEVLYQHEINRRCGRRESLMRAFQKVLMGCDFVDLGFMGAQIHLV